MDPDSTVNWTDQEVPLTLMFASQFHLLRRDFLDKRYRITFRDHDALGARKLTTLLVRHLVKLCWFLVSQTVLWEPPLCWLTVCHENFVCFPELVVRKMLAKVTETHDSMVKSKSDVPPISVKTCPLINLALTIQLCHAKRLLPFLLKNVKPDHLHLGLWVVGSLP